MSEGAAGNVRVDRDGAVWTVTIDRPAVRNAVDGAAARALADAFRAFDDDAEACVAVLTGAGGHFCAGADLRSVAGLPAPGTPGPATGVVALALDNDMGRDGPMGPTRMELGKPVIAAIEGHAVAGGLELAIWCDLRVASSAAVFGVFCRRFGVPLIDGGTVRLPRLIGESRALDLILTGRAVAADEALAIGLANRVVAPGTALAEAIALAHRLAALPQQCLRNDRLSTRHQHGAGIREALAQEFGLGLASLVSGEAEEGAKRFVAGSGRHGGSADT